MKNWSKTEILTIVILLLPFGYLAFTWNTFPDQVPVHFNHEGIPDRYGPKAFGLLLLPAINLLLFPLLKYIPKLDPRKENYALFANRYLIIRLVIHLFLTFLFFLIISSILKTSTLQPKLVIVGLAVVFMLLGNYLSTVRPNYFIGIRTPWTLENEEVWKKTHRFTGRLWVAAAFGLLVITLPLSRPNPIVLIVFVSLITLAPIIYSYLAYRNRENGNKIML